MTPDTILASLLTISPWTIFKLFILLSLFIFLIFALVVVKQVSIMTSTFRTGFEAPLKLISWLLFLLVAVIFILAIFLL